MNDHYYQEEKPFICLAKLYVKGELQALRIVIVPALTKEEAEVEAFYQVELEETQIALAFSYEEMDVIVEVLDE